MFFVPAARDQALRDREQRLTGTVDGQDVRGGSERAWCQCEALRSPAHDRVAQLAETAGSGIFGCSCEGVDERLSDEGRGRLLRFADR